ncbi:MAG: F0F1 ATP synthase subunit gamma [Gammaproteobacteria bacterium]|nr:F0F1 ATP synthase subunit gamma [Gammaproteobacteria bacterium]
MNSLKLVQHINSLADISDIMNAMKYLSVMESNKLSRLIQHQKRVMESIEFVANDFLHFNPQYIENKKPETHVIVVLGSERGFCGSYNDSLYQSLAKFNIFPESVEPIPIGDKKLISVGYKLHAKFEQHSQLFRALTGPKLVEEVPEVINNIIQAVSSLVSEYQAMRLTLCYHNVDESKPVFFDVLPAFQSLETTEVAFSTPALSNLTKDVLFYSLLDEYLFSVLNQIVYAAFMSENQYRIRHIENSLNKLNEKIEHLSLKRNEARQEEITEELEVIMLSSSVIENVE